jgi:hypothetical protein
MRFGTYYFLQAPPSISHPDVVRREIEQMVWTEELGFDSVWLPEHHFIEYGLSVSPAVLAAAAAMRTRHVRIGLAAAILPFHDPVRLAEELAIVDILSEGRLDVSVGRGNRPVEFEGYRVPQIENRERFDECLAIMLKAWTAERFSFEGRRFTIPEIRVIPKPLPAARSRRDALLDELRRAPAGARPALHGALRARGHAAFPLRGRRFRRRPVPFEPHPARFRATPTALVNAPTVNGFWSSGPSFGVSADTASLK